MSNLSLSLTVTETTVWSATKLSGVSVYCYISLLIISDTSIPHTHLTISLSLSLSLSLSASAQPFLGSRNKPSARILRWNSEFFRFGMNLGGRWEVQRFSFRFAVELLEWRELKGVCVFGGEDCGLRRLFFFFSLPWN